MSKIYIGVDNGVSGSWAFLHPDNTSVIHKTPVKKHLNYTKAKAWINRVDVPTLRIILTGEIGNTDMQNCMLAMERPMVNPGRFQATVSALRCLEATLIVIEELGIPHQYIDSKEWQKALLPSGLVGAELKEASAQVGKRKYPHLASAFKSDADSILIATYLKERNTKEL